MGKQNKKCNENTRIRIRMQCAYRTVRYKMKYVTYRTLINVTTPQQEKNKESCAISSNCLTFQAEQASTID